MDYNIGDMAKTALIVAILTAIIVGSGYMTHKINRDVRFDESINQTISCVRNCDLLNLTISDKCLRVEPIIEFSKGDDAGVRCVCDVRRVLDAGRCK